MKFFSVTRKCLEVSGLGNESHFEFCDFRFPRALIRWIILGNKISGIIVFSFLTYLNLQNGLQEILYLFHGAMLSAIRAIFYTILLTKSGGIAELEEFVRDVLNQRKPATLPGSF